MIENAARITRQAKAFQCLECGKCTANCPVSRFNRDYSPRMMLSRLLTGEMDELVADEKLYTCLACGMCRVRCPSDVRYTELMLLTRIEAHRLGHKPNLSHGGVLHEIMRIHAADKMRQDRGDWLGGDVQTAAEGELLYFGGCLPYFDAVFEEIGVEAGRIGRSAVRLLNAVGITPAVLPNERCCGHDLLWMGDEKGFIELMKHNIKAIAAAGAKRVVTSCAECYRTLALDYPRFGGKLEFEVVHISQLLSEQLSDLKGMLRGSDGTVTFHDPCRLGRHMGVYEPPRQLMAAIPDLEVLEMRHSRQASTCCGTSAWINCDMYSKQIQIGRLREAERAGAATVVTACPKCYIHFTCATSEKRSEPQVDVKIQDLCVLLAESLGAK